MQKVPVPHMHNPNSATHFSIISKDKNLLSLIWIRTHIPKRDVAQELDDGSTILIARLLETVDIC
jgi:hypothetical protein